MKPLFTLFALCLLSCGCASVPTAQRIPPIYDPSPSDAPLTDRAQSYQQMRVQVHPGYAVVDGQTFDPETMLEYYRTARVRQAYQLQRQSFGHPALPYVLPLASVLAGSLMGFVIEGNNSETGTGTTFQQGGTLGPQTDVLIGAIAGGIVGCFEYFGIKNSEKENLETLEAKQTEAANQFNHTLLLRLHLKIVPLPGGAKAGASLDY